MRFFQIRKKRFMRFFQIHKKRFYAILSDPYQVIPDLVRRQHLRLPLVAGENDHLPAVGFRQPFQRAL